MTTKRKETPITMNTEGQVPNDIANVLNAVNVDASGQVDATVSVQGQPVTVATPVTVDPKTAAMLAVLKAFTPAIQGGHTSVESALLGILAGFGIIRF